MKLKTKISLHIIPLILIIIIGFNIMFYKLYIHHELLKNTENTESFLKESLSALIEDMINERNYIYNFSTALLTFSSYNDLDIAIIDREEKPVISTMGYDIFKEKDLQKTKAKENKLILLSSKREKNNTKSLYSYTLRNKTLFIYIRYSHSGFNLQSILLPLAMIIFAQTSLLFFMIIIIINHNILKPIKALEKCAKYIEELKFEKEVDHVFQKDEFGILYNKMIIMKNALKNTRRDLLENIIELKETNSMLKKTQDQLMISERFSLIGKLSSSIAHEIGNPLNGITGYIDLLKMDNNSESEIKEYLEGMETEIDRIQNLIYSLLDTVAFNKSKVSSFNPYNEVCEIRNILLISREFKDKNLEIILSDEYKNTGIHQNKEFFRHIIFNLLHNALKFSYKGSHVDIIFDYRDKYLEITVRDYGIGIETHKEDIFNCGISNDQGSGLGLYLSRIFAEAMQGSLHYHKPDKKGSAFVLSIPSLN